MQYKYKTANEELLRLKNENEQNISFMQTFKTLNAPPIKRNKTKIEDRKSNIHRVQPTLVKLK